MGSRNGSLSAIPRPTRVNNTTRVVKVSITKISTIVVRFNDAFGSSGPGFLGLRDLEQKQVQMVVRIPSIKGSSWSKTFYNITQGSYCSSCDLYLSV